MENLSIKYKKWVGHDLMQLKRCLSLRFFVRILSFFFLFAALFSCGDGAGPKRFEMLDQRETGVDFVNGLIESDTMNILGFEYMYHGGGVAVGDINNDGLPDIYLTGNQVPDRLYLNKGNFKFEDITEQAGILSGGWSNGVTMADVNEDGLLDIYVSRGGTREWAPEEMANRLYINKGDMTFVEEADSYGVADMGYSMQGVFFDYDKDGDKDLYILTNALVNYNRNTSRYKTNDGSAQSTDQLYRNNGDGSFTNISTEAGITYEGFGLGVSIFDVNNDGWLDLYISNDFLTDDLLYVNNGDGSFRNDIKQYFRHLSYNGMGNDVADLNNDGHQELFTVDMFPKSNHRIKQTMMKPSNDLLNRNIQIGYSPQFVRNTLQLNNGNQTYSEIGQYSGVHNTDWSWAPLIADFDNDGNNDIFITNGFRRDITNLDYLSYTQRPANYKTEKDLVLGEIERVNNLPEVKLSNNMFKNEGDLSFSDKIEEWGFEKPLYSNGASYVDLDGDGDLDLIVSNIDDPVSIYRNNSREYPEVFGDNGFLSISLKGIGAEDLTGTQVWLYQGGRTQYKLYSQVRGYLSTMGSDLHFGLGKAEMDSLTVRWYDGSTQTLRSLDKNQKLVLKKAAAGSKTALVSQSTNDAMFQEVGADLGIDYQHREDNFDEFKLQTTLLRMNTNLGPGIAVGDINSDGLEDFYVGGTKEKKGMFFVQGEDGKFKEHPIACARVREEMGVVLVDVDGDGDLDLLSVDGGGIQEMAMRQYQDVIYYNDGAGNFTCSSFLSRDDRGGDVVLVDFDKDGDLDVFIAGRVINGSYPVSPKSYLLKNENGVFRDVTEEQLGSHQLGMVSDALWTDFDGDEWFDLILVGEFMEITFLKNENGKFQNVSNKSGLEKTSGWWNSIVAGDFDNDGDMDYVVGNFGLNSDFKCSPDEPVTLYTKDFDGNGAIDPLISCYRQGEEHLIHTRDILVDQISSMKGYFRDYESYASADFDEVRKALGFEGVDVKKAYTFASVYIENLGHGKFKRHELPKEVQFAPVYGMLVDDYDGDGNLDVLVTGNQYDIEPFIGQSDASIGYVLLGDGKNGFQVIDPLQSGISMSGSAKGAALLHRGSKSNLLLIGMNSGGLRVFNGAAQQDYIELDPMDAFAIVTMDNGRKRKMEFSYGTGYLGNSSRVLMYPKNTVNIVIHDFKGKKRSLIP